MRWLIGVGADEEEGEKEGWPPLWRLRLIGRSDVTDISHSEGRGPDQQQIS